MIKKLKEFTNKDGGFEINLNEHRNVYEGYIKQYYDIRNEEDEKRANIDFTKEIYHLIWHAKGRHGYYEIFANSCEELEKRILDLIEKEGLKREKTEND